MAIDNISNGIFSLCHPRCSVYEGTGFHLGNSGLYLSPSSPDGKASIAR